MDTLLNNISSFPTAIYSVILIICVVFWIGMVFGLSDMESFDGDIDVEIANGLDFEGGEGNENSTTNVFAALLVKFGLVGVPLTISITILALVGWILSYYVVRYLVPFEAGSMMRYLIGLPIFLGTLYGSAMITSRLIRPLKPFFDNSDQNTEMMIIGQTAVVRTSRVDEDFGEATLEDGGAGLILKVRATGTETFKTGDKVVIFEKLDKENNIYRVISEDDFEQRKLDK